MVIQRNGWGYDPKYNKCEAFDDNGAPLNYIWFEPNGAPQSESGFRHRGMGRLGALVLWASTAGVLISVLMGVAL